MRIGTTPLSYAAAAADVTLSAAPNPSLLNAFSKPRVLKAVLSIESARLKAPIPKAARPAPPASFVTVEVRLLLEAAADAAAFEYPATLPVVDLIISCAVLSFDC